MKKILLVFLMIVCALPGYAEPVGTEDEQNIFIDPYVADQVITEYFGHMVTNHKFDMENTDVNGEALEDETILNDVLDVYMEMLNQNDGRMSVTGLRYVCSEGFKYIKVDLNTNPNLVDSLRDYCLDFATNLLTRQFKFDNECIYEVSKVNGSQLKIKYQDKITGGGMIREDGSLASRFFNPGNLRRSSLQCAQLKTTPNGTFAVFESYDVGHQALINLLKTNTYQRLTVRQAIYKYAPPTENNTRQYLATLQTTGVPVDSKIASLKTDQFNRMVSMIETIEGWNKESKVTPF